MRCLIYGLLLVGVHSSTSACDTAINGVGTLGCLTHGAQNDKTCTAPCVQALTSVSQISGCRFAQQAGQFVASCSPTKNPTASPTKYFLNVNAAGADNCSLLPDVAVDGTELKWWPGVSLPSSCCALCAETQGCLAFTANSSGCSLHDGTEVVQAPNATSGLVPGPSSPVVFPGCGTFFPSNTTTINCADLGLTGSIPESLGKLVNLKNLYLNDNDQLNGSIPESLGGLINLEELSLFGNQLTGSIPASLGGLVKLEHLDLGENQLTGSIPASLGGLVHLEELYLYMNQLTGSIPWEMFKEMAQVHSLRVLGLGDNKFTVTEVPSIVGDLTNLQKLLLEGLGYTGSIPWDMFKTMIQAHSLTGLGLGHNQFTVSEIPSTFGNLTNLQELDLSELGYTGSIPASLGGLVKLKLLNLEGNELTGSIPESLGKLVKLTTLHLYGNKLTGSIPPESLGGLINLRELELDRNQLTETIPESFGKLVNLTYVELNQNKLTGSIPESLGGLSNLWYLDLNGNQLTGCQNFCDSHTHIQSCQC